MWLHAKQCLDDKVFELSNNVLVVNILLLVGGLKHLEVPLRGVLVKLLLVFGLQRGASRSLVFRAGLVGVFDELIDVLFVD
jgi:hypothetical protein